MSIQSDDRQPLGETRSSAEVSDDDGILIPGSAPPLSPGRTDVNPDDQPGVDELPGDGLGVPRVNGNDNPVERETPDMDVDNAEMDDAPNPR
ncbi:hypothetical protein NAV33_00675 [Pseudomonas stutzeri]|uniref:hypothetical protein n=1 Tax=Stutzerimonas stutzeri TaxID=316 RepID=UPI00210BC7EE|nr:hypothetical protein [Stutzerimonas stutzeri]MCQ4310415.1 hypothetical protein [Stutzerimonas stutzeri]